MERYSKVLKDLNSAPLISFTQVLDLQGEPDVIKKLIAQKKSMFHERFRSMPRIKVIHEEDHLIADISRLNIDSKSFADRLLTQEKLEILPLEERSIKLPLGTSLDDIDIGMDRFKNFYDNL